MELHTNDVQAESSPAIEVPRDGAAYAKWRQTGELPEAKPAQPKGESAPPKESSAEGQQPKEKSAPVSETGKQDQERQKPPRDNAATRLNEILEDLRKANLTPAELKTFKREAQKAAEQVEQPKAAPEKTENPTELKAPTKPKQEDFKTYEEFEAAKDKYFEDMADYKAAKKFQEFQVEQARNSAYQRVQQKLNEAATKYADDPAAVETIQATSRALVSDQQIPLAVKAIIDQSDVWPDIVYTLGSKPEELQAFIKLAKENPGAAIRKAVLIEHLVTQELSKGSKSPKADDTPRDESGKFQKTPEKEESDAPRPPREVSGRGATPPDEVNSAVKNNDFRKFRDSQNAKDMSLSRRR
jgi:hypothetical protein